MEKVELALNLTPGLEKEKGNKKTEIVTRRVIEILMLMLILCQTHPGLFTDLPVTSPGPRFKNVHILEALGLQTESGGSNGAFTSANIEETLQDTMDLTNIFLENYSRIPLYLK